MGILLNLLDSRKSFNLKQKLDKGKEFKTSKKWKF